jgi:hypothetical protein
MHVYAGSLELLDHEPPACRRLQHDMGVGGVDR